MKKTHYIVFSCLLVLTSTVQLHGMFSTLSRFKTGLSKNLVRFCSTSSNRQARIKQHMRNDIKAKKESIAQYLRELGGSIKVLKLRVLENGEMIVDVQLYDEDAKHINQDDDGINDLANQLASIRALEASVCAMHGYMQYHRIFNEREKIKRDFDDMLSHDNAHKATQQELQTTLESYYSKRED